MRKKQRKLSEKAVSVRISFGERTDTAKLNKIAALKTNKGLGKQITTPIYSKKQAPDKVVIRSKGGYTKKYAQKILREREIELPTEYFFGDTIDEESPITPRNVLDFLNEYVQNYDKNIEKAMQEKNYDIPRAAKDRPRLKEIEILYIYF